MCSVSKMLSMIVCVFATVRSVSAVQKNKEMKLEALLKDWEETEGHAIGNAAPASGSAHSDCHGANCRAASGDQPRPNLVLVQRQANVSLASLLKEADAAEESAKKKQEAEELASTDKSAIVAPDEAEALKEGVVFLQKTAEKLSALLEDWEKNEGMVGSGDLLSSSPHIGGCQGTNCHFSEVPMSGMSSYGGPSVSLVQKHAEKKLAALLKDWEQSEGQPIDTSAPASECSGTKCRPLTGASSSVRSGAAAVSLVQKRADKLSALIEEQERQEADMVLARHGFESISTELAPGTELAPELAPTGRHASETDEKEGVVFLQTGAKTLVAQQAPEESARLSTPLQSFEERLTVVTMKALSNETQA